MMSLGLFPNRPRSNLTYFFFPILKEIKKKMCKLHKKKVEGAESSITMDQEEHWSSSLECYRFWFRPCEKHLGVTSA